MNRIKAEVYLEGLGNDITSPFFDHLNALHFILQDSGEICKLDHSAQMKPVSRTGGQPADATFGSNKMMYVTDFAHGAVLAIQGEQQEEIVTVYEDKPLKGPNSIAIDSSGTIYFSDSGPLGETGLHNSTGSLFMINNSAAGQILKPISLENLAYPSGIALSPSGRILYVTEMMTNRILRFFQKPDGVFHGSVFYQNTGGVGPSCITVDKDGKIYIGIYDIKEATSDGTVLVLDKIGKLINTIITKGPEVSGLIILKNTLYITEKTTGSIQQVDI